MADIADRSAVELAADVRARKLGGRDVVAACLARIEQANGVLNAVCTLNPAALADAEAADRRLAAGTPARLLEGIPFLVKDVIPTRGIRTTYGSKLHEHLVPDEDAVSVERLKAAGAILLGKTNTPEFATDVYTTNAIFGPTRNPWDARTTAGGSSGGSGAAVAAGMAPLALGTDFGGSVRLPAAFCGIVGLRPAPGRIPLYPTDFAWDTLVTHVHGPMTRTVEDTALMFAALAGPDDRDPSSLPADGVDHAAAGRSRTTLAGRRFAWCGDLGGLVPVDPEVMRVTNQAARALEGLGAIVEDVAFDASDLKEIIAGTRAFAMVARFGELVEAHGARMAEPLVRQVTDARAFDVKAVARTGVTRWPRRGRAGAGPVRGVWGQHQPTAGEGRAHDTGVLQRSPRPCPLGLREPKRWDSPAWAERLVYAVPRMRKHSGPRAETFDLVRLLDHEVLEGRVPAGAAPPHDDGPLLVGHFGQLLLGEHGSVYLTARPARDRWTTTQVHL